MIDYRKLDTVTLHRDGIAFFAGRHPMILICFGSPTGAISGASCYESVTFRDERCRQMTATAEGFGGPLSVRIRRADGTREWAGVADAATVAEAALDRITANQGA